MTTSKTPIRSTQISIAVLDAVLELEEPTLTDLARELDVSKSAIHNHLVTLTDAGFVVRDGYRYRVGSRLLQYGAAGRRSYDVFEQAKTKADEIAQETGDQVNVVFEEHGRGVVVYQREGPEAVNTGLKPGSVLPLHATAAGKAILAFSDEDRVEEILDRYGLPPVDEGTITDRDAFHEELDDIRNPQPWVAFDRSDRARGIKSIGTPLIDSEVRLLDGAISVTMPNSRFYDEAHQEAVIDTLETERSIISTNVSYE
jgi:DNA-binding IclR family transcriptional regulator